MEGVICFDIDRVLYDTNGFLAELRSKFGSLLKEEFGERRKSLKKIWKKLKEVGKEEELLKMLKKYRLKGRAKKIIEKLSKHYLLIAVSVGDHLQLLKVEDLPLTGVVVVENDEEKVKRVLSLASMHKNFYFIDDKKEVVDILRKRGINAIQALWFLDEEYRKRRSEAYVESLEGLLKSFKKSGGD